MNTIDQAWDRIERVADSLVSLGCFPLWTHAGKWETIAFEDQERGVLPHNGSWMVGDLPAILWFIASREGNDAGLRSRAFQYSTRLRNRSTLKAFASVSHLFFRGALVGLTIAGEKKLEPLVSAAAATIASRFQEIGYMKSFGGPEDHSYPFTTVDDAINLVMPLWHAKKTGDRKLEKSVLSAADEIAEHLIRADGSTAQVLRMDDHGHPAGVDTYQGRSPDTCWSRGQAWGIYGYATLYRMARKPEYLDLAQRMADYWMSHVRRNPSPVWDFSYEESADVPRDSFAASLAYAGILELAALSDSAYGQKLVAYARDMLDRLTVQYALCEEKPTGILAGAALDVPHNHGINSSVIVGDSYYTEALWRLGTPGGVVSLPQ